MAMRTKSLKILMLVVLSSMQSFALAQGGGMPILNMVDEETGNTQ